MKKVRLDKRWKEILFAAAGFGPNLLMVLMSAYFSDALMPHAVATGFSFYTYGPVIVSTLLFPFLWFIGKLFDGIIDVPLGAWTDNLQNKTGNRFIGLLVSFVPMLVSYILCWIPIFGFTGSLSELQRLGNTAWIFVWAVIFFAAYTLGLITFYGSLSDVCENQTQRARVSAYKSVFDTITYAVGYAAIPAIFGAIGLSVWQVAIILSPLMFTILIPLFMGNKTITKDEIEHSEKQIPLGKSFSLTFKSKPFMKWIVVYCFSFFGLQLFLASQNTIISSVIHFNSISGTLGQTILNTCAFAPVPLFILLFNRVRKSQGIRVAYQSALLAFAVGILMLGFAGDYIWKGNDTAKLIIAITGSIIGSWGIGAFFMVPYLIPTSIASVEEEVTGKNHSAMYFAVQALFSTAAGALSSTLLYDYLKQWVENPQYLTAEYDYIDPAAKAELLGMRFGDSLVPLIIFIACVAGFFIAFNMPKKYTPKIIYEDLKQTAQKKYNAVKRKLEILKDKKERKINKINLSKYDDLKKKQLIADFSKKIDLKINKLSKTLEENNKVINMNFDESKSVGNEERRLIEKNSIFGVVALFVLTGGIYNIVSLFIDLDKIKKLGGKVKWYDYLLISLSFVVPFLSIYTVIYFNKFFKNRKEKIKYNPVLCIIFSCVLPMFMNVVELAKRTESFNVISDSISKE